MSKLGKWAGNQAIGMAEGVISRGGQALGDLIFGSSADKQLKQQEKLLKMSNKYAMQLGDYNKANELEMYKATGMEAKVAEMEKLGINPMILGGGLGDGQLGGSSAGNVDGGQASGEAEREMAQIQKQMMGIQMEEAKSRIEKNLADAADKKSGTKFRDTVETEERKVNIANTLKDIEIKGVKEEGYKIDNQIKAIDEMVADATSEEKIRAVFQANQKVEQEIEKLKTEITKGHGDIEEQAIKISQLDEQLELQRKEIVSRMLKNNSDIKLNAQQEEFLTNEIINNIYKLENERRRLDQEDKYISERQKETLIKAYQYNLNVRTQKVAELQFGYTLKQKYILGTVGLITGAAIGSGALRTGGLPKKTETPKPYKLEERL